MSLLGHSKGVTQLKHSLETGEARQGILKDGTEKSNSFLYPFSFPGSLSDIVRTMLALLRALPHLLDHLVHQSKFKKPTLQ